MHFRWFTPSFSLRSKIGLDKIYWGERILNLKNRKFFKFKIRSFLKITFWAIFEQSEKEPVSYLKAIDTVILLIKKGICLRK
jgi:hypothetical protein